jgi:FMN-dependent oxidoreductase (nitrilotriacetate monooxygenase family)
MVNQTPILVLNLGLGPVFHPAAWRHSDVDLSAVFRFDAYRDLVAAAEAAKLHAVFSADTLGLDPAELSRTPVRGWEPFTFFAALAASTRRIGLLLSASTTFAEPFNLARQLSSIDKISNGRVGWNIVTSALDRAAQNFGLRSLPDHDARYARAEEFLQVVTRLWSSWAVDALRGERDSGVLFDPDKVADIDHSGEYFQVRGPLNTFASPQGWPVLSQAGDSVAGRRFAARFAEVVYTRHGTLAAAGEYYRDIKAQAEDAGRDPAGVKVLSGKDLIIAESRAAAQDKRGELSALTSWHDSIIAIRRSTGVDLRDLSRHDPVPDLPVEDATNNGQGALRGLRALAGRDEVRTVGDLADALTRQRDSSIVAGTAKDVADLIEEWYGQGVADGFVVGPVLFPGSGELFLHQVVPELRRRGLFRHEYQGATLREDLGLPPLTALRRSLGVRDLGVS